MKPSSHPIYQIAIINKPQFGGALLGTTFKEQSKRWEDLVLSHVSDAIILVHDFILQLLEHIFSEKQVLRELWENVLLEKLQGSYRRAMDHTRFLLEIEREGKPMTHNNYFSSGLQRAQAERLQQSLSDLEIDDVTGPVIKVKALSSLKIWDKSNPAQVREQLHDILQSYYEVSLKRFVDVVCQQVVDHFLLNGKDSPLRVFSTELVFSLSASELEMIAGEDQITKQERERLGREIDSLQAAMQVLRG